MAQSQTSFHLNNFPNPIVNSINGKPTFTTLYKLQSQIKANASSVPSTLGGGRHGHLGLVLTPVKYNTISLIPFVKPRDPGESAFTENMTWEQIQAVPLANRDS